VVTFNKLVQELLEQANTAILTDRDKDILATLLVKEAGGEKDYIAGMAGVMNVLQARSKNNPKDFVNQATRKFQFSAFNAIKTPQQMDQLITATKSHRAFKAAKEMVEKAVQGKLTDITSKSTHYYAASGPNKISPPKWADPAKKTNKIGHHQYYTNIK